TPRTSSAFHGYRGSDRVLADESLRECRDDHDPDGARRGDGRGAPGAAVTATGVGPSPFRRAATRPHRRALPGRPDRVLALVRRRRHRRSRCSRGACRGPRASGGRPPVTSTFQVLIGTDGDLRAVEPAFYDLLDTLEVEENTDLPGAFELTLPITTTDAVGGEDLTLVGDEQYGPFARIAVVVRVDGAAEDACIFDGYVLAHTVHLAMGTTASTLKVWGQDVACLMDLVDKAQLRSGTDSDIAKAIFGDHGVTAADENADDPGPDQDLMQRGTDAQFLRERARRTGRVFRVCCGQRPGENKGYFAKPNLDANAAMSFVLHPVDAANVDALDFTWDVARPSAVAANALVRTKDVVDGGATASGLSSLGRGSLEKFVPSEHASKVRLTTAVGDAGELRRRSEALLREAGW